MNQSPDTPHMVTRFAPSPTGRLHVGHAWSALMAKDVAEAAGGILRLRIEDIDGARSRAEHIDGIIEDLRWLGINWDGEIIFQSQRLDHYAAALDRLRDMDLLYPCFCTRADIMASTTAPHGPEGPIYPGTCRMLSDREREERIAVGEAHAWRIDMAKATARVGVLEWKAFVPSPARFELVENGALKVSAGANRMGPVVTPPLLHGDVVLARKDAPASYHLSCTLDDAAMGVTHVLRGSDLQAVTDIHRLLQALLGLPSPAYLHHPLLLGPDGRRLAKRAGSIALADLRGEGVDPLRLAADLRAGVFPVGISLGEA